ncbi:MarR family transcriptional regulator [Paenibacillus sp. FSL H8-0548]|uniref:MarR family winged helix-turn-helix transcriptional regulator n=1 Tax=Paenibacillus sp. FSL H8-0548 TaxID=1920422 RepID=UPI00096D0D0D|nr:MarR family transcriptional regulator [Paenibacillus sp. FSL H8-0548]OMF30056.1 MarR family transcriptional regulator [Paenibacillus sp. FSL H8-0548]
MDNNAMFQKFVAFTTAVHQTTNEISQDIRPKSITPVQYKILEYISVSQPVTLSKISDCMLMSMPNTSRELKKLTDKELCEKVTDEEDRRKQFIRLSAKGEAMMGEAFGFIAARFAQRIEKESEEEMQELAHALELLHRKVFY